MRDDLRREPRLRCLAPWLALAAVIAQGLREAALLAVGAVYVQLALGAVMRHVGAGLAIPDFPLAFGKVIPPFWSAGIVVHFAHRLGALLVLACVLVLARRAQRSGDPRFARPAALALGLAALQIGLGALTVLTGKAVLPTTAHVATGAAVLGACFFLLLRAFRLRAARARLPAALQART